MKKNSIKIIISTILIAIVLILLILIIIKNVNNKLIKEQSNPSDFKDKIEVIETSFLSSERNFLNLSFTGFVVENLNGNRTIYVYITNKTNEEIKEKKATLILYDSSKIEILKSDITINALKPNEAYTLKIPIDKDVSSVFDYEILEK